MTTFKGRALAGVGITAAMIGTVGGLWFATPAPAQAPVSVPKVQATPAPKVPTKAQVYSTYIEVYGKGNGCREDFDRNYFGLVRYDSLPEKLQQQIAEDSMAMHDEPFLEDYHDGSLLTLRQTPEYVAYLGPYRGDCK